MESNDPVSKLAATVTGSRNDDKGLNGGVSFSNIVTPTQMLIVKG